MLSRFVFTTMSEMTTHSRPSFHCRTASVGFDDSVFDPFLICSEFSRVFGVADGKLKLI